MSFLNSNMSKLNIAGVVVAILCVTPLRANTSISVSVFNQQQHFAYRDAYGNIWDAWYNGAPRVIPRWNLQKINNDGNTDGPPASYGPFVTVLNQQQHFTYLDWYGTVFDAWYDGLTNTWNLQKITDGGRTSGPSAASTVFVSVFNQQQHFAYCDSGGTIWDAWYDGVHDSWNLQKINNGGTTSGPSASSSGIAVFVSVFKQQQHFAYSDPSGTIWDAWYDGVHSSWNLQKINDGGNTNGPATIGAPSVSVFNQQQHFAYEDLSGDVWDAWYNGPAGSWNLQRINESGNTSGPPGSSCCSSDSAYNPAVSVFNQQQHFAYPDDYGTIWDAWYNGPENTWNLQKINLGGVTSAPAATGGPIISVFGQQQHFAFQASDNSIWDAWYDGSTNKWNSQKINLGGVTYGPAAAPDGPGL